MTQKFLGHPLSVFYPQDCPKSPRETEILRTPYKARSGFSILTEEYLTFQTGSPTDSSVTHIKGQWENLVCRNHAGSDSYRGGGLHRQKSRRQRQKPALLRYFAIRRGLCR